MLSVKGLVLSFAGPEILQPSFGENPSSQTFTGGPCDGKLNSRECYGARDLLLASLGKYLDKSEA